MDKQIKIMYTLDQAFKDSLEKWDIIIREGTDYIRGEPVDRRIYINSKGDPSVGMPSMAWTIDGEIYIEEEDLEAFRNHLKLAWEYICDDAVFDFD